LLKTKAQNTEKHVITELKNRAIEDIFIACVDELKDFSDALAASLRCSYVLSI